MRIRSSILVVAIATGATACGGAGAGKIMADTTILPYQAPDIDELTGIDSDAEAEEAADKPTTPAPAPTPAPQK